MTQYTDKQLLDYLQTLNNNAEFNGKCMLTKGAITGRWILEEGAAGQHADVREAIIAFINEQRGIG